MSGTARAKEMTNKGYNKQSGFTLVELAIVMIIIGLLIGGVLKGQELVTNAKITSTISQVKSIDAATSTFFDMFNAYPGDIANPGARLPSCTAAPCSDAGDADSTIEPGPGAVVAIADEAFAFWSHLAAAELISGVDSTTNTAFGQGLPKADIGGGFTIGHTTSALDGTSVAGRIGHYLALRGSSAVVAAGNSFVPVSPAARIDRKLDDGVPNLGTVRGAGGLDNSATACANGTATTDLYNEDATSGACSLYIKLSL